MLIWSIQDSKQRPMYEAVSLCFGAQAPEVAHEGAFIRPRTVKTTGGLVLFYFFPSLFRVSTMPNHVLALNPLSHSRKLFH